MPAFTYIAFAALALCAGAKAAAQADPWTSTSYQARQWDGAVRVSTDGYLQQKCLAKYRQKTVTARSTSTVNRQRTLATIKISTTTVKTTTTAVSTTRPILTSFATSTALKKVRSTTTSYSVATVTSIAPFRRRKRAAAATGLSQAHKQIDNIFTNLLRVNEPYLKAQCGSLTAATKQIVSTTTLSGSTVITRSTKVTRTSTSTKLSVLTIPTTTTSTRLFSTTSTVPVTRVIPTTTVVVQPPSPTDTVSFVTCPNAASGYMLLSESVPGIALLCYYASTTAQVTYACNYNAQDGTFRSASSTAPSGACPPTLTESDATGVACYDWTACPAWDDHDLSLYGSGALLGRTGNGTIYDSWNMQLACQYDDGDRLCIYDQDSEMLVYGDDGDDSCPDSLATDNFSSSGCAFADMPAVATVPSPAPPPPAPAPAPAPSPAPSTPGAYGCPTPSNAYILGYILQGPNNLFCQYNNNDNAHNNAYYCQFSQSTGAAVNVDSRCGSTAPSDTRITSGTYPYKLTSACPTTVSGATIDTSNASPYNLQQTALALLYDFQPALRRGDSYLSCKYTGSIRCVYDIETGSKIASTTWGGSSDASCPNSVPVTASSPAPAPAPADTPPSVSYYRPIPNYNVNVDCPVYNLSPNVYLSNRQYFYNDTLVCYNDRDHAQVAACQYNTTTGALLQSYYGPCPEGNRVTALADVRFRGCPTILSGQLLLAGDDYETYMNFRTGANGVTAYNSLECAYSQNGAYPFEFRCYVDPTTGALTGDLDAAGRCPTQFGEIGSIVPNNGTFSANSVVM